MVPVASKTATQNGILTANGNLKKVESIAECSFGAFCNTFNLHKAIIGIERQCLVLILSCGLRQFFLHIPDKKRNAPLRTVQLSGRPQVIGQFSLYQCKGMSGAAASYVFLPSGVEIVLKIIGHEQSGDQIVNSQEISVFIMLPCWISSSSLNHLIRPNYTQTLILCKFFL